MIKKRITIPYLHRVVIHILVGIVRVHIDTIIFNTDQVVDDSGFTPRCGLTVIEINTVGHIRAINGIVFHHVSTIAVIKADTCIVQTGAFYGIAPDRYSIKIFSIDTAMGIRETVVDNLKTRSTGGPITQVNGVAAAVGKAAVLDDDPIILIRDISINKAIIGAATVMIIALKNTVVKGDVICTAPDLN